MKKILSIIICISLFASVFSVSANGYDIEKLLETQIVSDNNNTRATGLVLLYGIQIAKSGTTLQIEGETTCAVDVVRSGFKNLTVERRKNSSYSWESYYEYGNVYRDTNSTNIYTELTVERGYQYRVTCKHYAKKSLFVTQTISNTSNIVTVS